MLKITLHDARKQRGYTPSAVAINCGLTVSYYNNIESNPGQAPLSVISKVATFLGIKLSIIFPGGLEDCIKYNRSKLISLHSLTTNDHILSTQLSKLGNA